MLGNPFLLLAGVPAAPGQNSSLWRGTHVPRADVWPLWTQGLSHDCVSPVLYLRGTLAKGAPWSLPKDMSELGDSIGPYLETRMWYIFLGVLLAL